MISLLIVFQKGLVRPYIGERNIGTLVEALEHEAKGGGETNSEVEG